MVRRSGLGKGLGALLPGAEEGTLMMCEVGRLSPNPFQPRRGMREEGIEELARSIKEKGVLQPILVRRKDSNYEIVVGERRWRAAQRAGLKEIPVIVKDISDREALEMALVENLQREDLDPIEQAEAFLSLMREYGYTQEEVARRVGKDRSSVANTVRLLKLPEEVKEALRKGEITAGHARALLAEEDPERQKALCAEVIRKGLSVRETEELVRGKRPSRRKSLPLPDPEVERLVEELQQIFKTRVRILRKGERGKIELEFYSLDDFDRIVEILRRQGQ